MIREEITIKSESGLHSRLAALLIQKASGYQSSIWIENGERKANAKSLLGLLSLSIGPGDRAVIIAEGPDESKAIDELKEYLENLEKC